MLASVLATHHSAHYIWCDGGGPKQALADVFKLMLLSSYSTHSIEYTAFQQPFKQPNNKARSSLTTGDLEPHSMTNY